MLWLLQLEWLQISSTRSISISSYLSHSWMKIWNEHITEMVSCKQNSGGRCLLRMSHRWYRSRPCNRPIGPVRTPMVRANSKNKRRKSRKDLLQMIKKIKIDRKIVMRNSKNCKILIATRNYISGKFSTATKVSASPRVWSLYVNSTWLSNSGQRTKLKKLWTIFASLETGLWDKCLPAPNSLGTSSFSIPVTTKTANLTNK